ncbi:MAG: YaaR family protein [Bacillota bacterium]|nr:YaaR family protein [Bacillota bacterium]
MKVEGASAKKKGAVAPLASGRKSGAAAVAPARFSELLEEAREGARRQALDGLLSEIDSAAEDLKRHRTWETLLRYKELIQKFLQAAVGEMYQVREQVSVDRRGRRRLFTLVQKVNAAVEELTHLVLEKQAPTIELLAKIGEIRGLLVDLYT